MRANNAVTCSLFNKNRHIAAMRANSAFRFQQTISVTKCNYVLAMIMFTLIFDRTGRSFFKKNILILLERSALEFPAMRANSEFRFQQTISVTKCNYILAMILFTLIFDEMKTSYTIQLAKVQLYSTGLKQSEFLTFYSKVF